MGQAIYERLKKLIDKSQRALILLHLYPDGDTIASSLALAAYLKSAGKTVDLAARGEIPKAFEFLPGTDEIKHDFLLGDYDLIFAVDCGDAHRTGYPDRLEKICKSHPLINIDHHPKNNLHTIARLNIVDGGASAAAEIIWELLRYFDAEIDSRIATYILSGIYFDTGGFQHSNVTVKTLTIISDCLRLGGRIALVASHINGSKSSAGLRLWGIALKRMRISPRGIVTTFLTSRDLKECGAKSEDASGVINLINSTPNARLSILFLELPDGKIKASLRSESEDVDMAEFARLFGGGGHRKAAGFTIEGRLVEKDGKWGII
jgi:phosphoesterase RecJ-like protein